MKNFITKPFIEGLKDNDKGRPDKIKKEGVLPVGAEWIISDEDEIKRLEEKDPQKNYWVDVEDLSAEQNLGEFIGGLNIDPNLSEAFEDEYEEFENKDLIKEMALEAKKKREKKEKKIEHKEPGTYTLFEFQLMENCAKFEALLDKLPLLKKMRPVFAKKPGAKVGEPLTDDQITEQAKDYDEKCKKEGKWSDYSKFELKLMKDCSIWQYFDRKISINQKSPIFSKTRELLNEIQITKQAKEYEDFKNEKPEEFAELNALSKVENKKWQKAEFKWKLGEYKGKSQWSCYKSKNLIDKDGKTKKIKTRYVVSEIPAGLNPDDVKTSFFNVRFIKKIDDSFFIAFIELKPPFIYSEKKKLEIEKTPA